jgi:hypothetical protein
MKFNNKITMKTRESNERIKESWLKAIRAIKTWLFHDEQCMKWGYHSLISEAFQAASDQSIDYDSDQEEKLVFVWTEENDSTKKWMK